MGNGKRVLDVTEFNSRAVAAMVALGIGDAAGDLGRDDAVRQRYGLVTSLLKEGKSTDDTEFTVLSAVALLSSVEPDGTAGRDGGLKRDGGVVEQLQTSSDRFPRFTPDHVATCWKEFVLADGGAKERGGMPLYGALWNLSCGIEPPLSGQDNVFNVDDGAAMRSVPFGIVAVGEPQEAARLAAIDACVSHDRDGIWAAQAIAASIAVALTGAGVDAVVKAGIDQIPVDSWLGRRMRLAMELVDSDDPKDVVFERLHTRLWTPKHSSAPEAIPQIYALYRLAEGRFKEGFLLSANFGRDADTICALTLALCAAGEGLGVIPDSWIDQVRKPSGVCLSFAAKEDMVDLAERLVRIGSQSPYWAD